MSIVNILSPSLLVQVRMKIEEGNCLMDSKSEDIRPNGKSVRSVDDFDRRILGALTGDARLTYAEVGQIAGLSAPAVHERVRRLKASGVLAGTTTRIDAASVGKPFLAFVHVDADGWGKSQRMM